MDLTHFSNYLYKLLPALALSPAMEEAPKPPGTQALAPHLKPRSTSDLLFRALTLVLTPKHGRPPSYLTAAFAKRLLTLALHAPSATSVKALAFVTTLLGLEDKLDAMLSTEEKAGDGIYRPDVEDPQLCNPFACVWWEIAVLEDRHWDKDVRKAASALRRWKPT